MRVDLRNRGLELGDTSFWEADIIGVLLIESTEVHRGAYSLKVTADPTIHRAYLRHTDYIPVEAGDIIDMEVYVKGAVGDNVAIMVERFDADLNSLETQSIKYTPFTGLWQSLRSQYVVDTGIAYCRLYLASYGTAGVPITYVDDASVSIFDRSKVGEMVIEIAALTDKTASDDTSTDRYRMFGFRDYYAEIDVTSVSGTTPTVDVEVCELDSYDNERILGTFTQFNGVTDQRVGIAAPIGKGMYVKYVMGGTVTDCDFKVSVIGVR